MFIWVMLMLYTEIGPFPMPRNGQKVCGEWVGGGGGGWWVVVGYYG